MKIRLSRKKLEENFRAFLEMAMLVWVCVAAWLISGAILWLLFGWGLIASPVHFFLATALAFLALSVEVQERGGLD